MTGAVLALLLVPFVSAVVVLSFGQMLLLPAYLWAFAGAQTVALVEITPFVQAFVVLIVIPLTAAATVQWAAPRAAAARAVEGVMAAAMVRGAQRARDAVGVTEPSPLPDGEPRRWR